MTLSQVAFRFREDDGSETAATWIAAQNTNWSPSITANRQFRLRFELQETGGATGTSNAQVQYNINSQGWATADPTTIGVHLASSSFVTNGQATTDQLTTGTGTFSAGQIRTTLTAATASMAASGHTEHEFVIQLDFGYFNNGDIVTFRILDNGLTITYSVTPQITITKVFNEPPTISPNTSDATNFGLNTPTFESTATDPTSNDVEYAIHIDSQSNMQGGESLNASFATVTNGYAFRSGNASRVGQAFQATASGRIRRARFFLWKTGAPTVKVVAKLYACTGTLGTSAVATGNPLATSYTTINSSDLLLTLANGQWCDFYFIDEFSLVSGTNYVIACEVVIGSGTDDASNCPIITGSSTGGHAGNYTAYAAGAWAAASANDVGFYLYTGSVVYTSMSSSGLGWQNTVTTSDTSPYNSGEKAQHTIQSNLSTGTYYWRMTARDPTASNLWSWAPTAIRSFSVTQPLAQIQTVGQYRNDSVTTLAIGASTTDGITNKIFLANEYSSTTINTPLVPKAEVRNLATSLNNTATITGKTLVQRDTATTTYTARGGNLIHDTLNDRLIFFGGFDGTSRHNEVWSKDMAVPGAPWRKLSPSGTPHTAVNLGSATYVRATNSSSVEKAYLIVWGGTDGTNDYNTMTRLDLTTVGSEAWASITQTNAMSTRSFTTRHMVATPVSGFNNQNYIYYFGGWPGATRENGLYRCTFDVNSPGAVTWTTLFANGAGGQPSARSGTILDYNPNDGKLYLFGGYNGTTYLSDIWRYTPTGNTWAQLSPTGTAPAGRELGAGGYDKTNDRFWYSGGWQGTTGNNRNDIGYISGVSTTPAYVEVRANDGAMGSRQYFTSHSSSANCIDSIRNYMHIYSPYMPDDFIRYHYTIDLNESYTTDYPVYGASEGEFLTARDAMAHVWNPDKSHWVIFNGYGNMSDDLTISKGSHIGDIWTYTPSTNKWRFAVSGYKQMPSTEGVTAVYDSNRQRIVAFGGLTGVQQFHNEAFELVPDSYGNYKVNKLRPSGTRPDLMWLSHAVYDATNDRAIFALGGNGSNGLNKVFALNFSGGANGSWSQLTPTGTVTAVMGGGFANDPTNKRLYIYGGTTVIALTDAADQLIYLDYSTTNCAWNTITQTGGIARRTPALGFDASNNQLILFGGRKFSPSAAESQDLQFFSLSGSTWTSSAAPLAQPAARRSLVGDWFNNKFYVFAGRTESSGWFNDTWSLVPNYSTPNNSTFTNLSPKVYNPSTLVFTNGTNNTGYHWQAWLSNTGNTQDTAKVSFGGNSESSADFVIGTIVVSYNVRLSSMIPFFRP